jgi:hypothetical protein
MLYSLLLRDSLALRVDVSGSVRAGEPVRMAVRLTNKTERVLTLALRGGERAFDLTAARADGTIVWQLLHGGTVSKGSGERMLEPAESLVFEASWDGRAAGGPASPGQYLVTGKLFIEGEEPLVSRPARLELFSSRPGSV